MRLLFPLSKRIKHIHIELYFSNKSLTQRTAQEQCKIAVSRRLARCHQAMDSKLVFLFVVWMATSTFGQSSAPYQPSPTQISKCELLRSPSGTKVPQTPSWPHATLGNALRLCFQLGGLVSFDDYVRGCSLGFKTQSLHPSWKKLHQL